MDAVQLNEFTIYIMEITKEGFFSIGLVDDGQRTRMGFIAFRHTTSIQVCLFANFVRSDVYFLTFRFKYTNCHTIDE